MLIIYKLKNQPQDMGENYIYIIIIILNIYLALLFEVTQLCSLRKAYIFKIEI